MVTIIPTFLFALSPLKYLVYKKAYQSDTELEKIIQSKGFNYKVVIVKGKLNNAYATGVLPFIKIILIGEYLKENMSEKELLAIIYHEIGHLKLNHLIKLYIVSLVITILIVVFMIIKQQSNVDIPAVYEPFLIFGIGAFAGLLYWYIPGKIQYKFELEADSFASKIVGSENYKLALEKLDALSDGDVSKGGITHPPLSKRIDNISSL